MTISFECCSLGVKLAMLANPLACFLGFCAFRQSFIVLNILTAVAMASAAYIIVIASYSPTPPVEGVAGAVFMVSYSICWYLILSFTGRICKAGSLLSTYWPWIFWPYDLWLHIVENGVCFAKNQFIVQLYGVAMKGIKLYFSGLVAYW